MTEEAPTERTALYRLYDTESTLLYVGTSYQPEKRFKQHAHMKNWWHHVVRKEIRWFNTQQEALSAEAATVKAEGPLYDATHRLGDGARHFPRVRYDDSADIESLASALRNLLQAGELRPRARLYPLSVAERFGFSRSIALDALQRLVKEGLLSRRRSSFEIPQ